MSKWYNEKHKWVCKCLKLVTFGVNTMTYSQNTLSISSVCNIVLNQQNFILVGGRDSKINKIKEKFDIINRRMSYQKYEGLELEFIDIISMIDSIIRDNELSINNVNNQNYNTYEQKADVEFKNYLSMVKIIHIIIEKCIEIFNNIENSSVYDKLIKDFQNLAYEISNKYLFRGYNNPHSYLDDDFWDRYNIYHYLKNNNLLKDYIDNSYHYYNNYQFSTNTFSNIAKEYDDYKKIRINITLERINQLLVECANNKLLFNQNKRNFEFDILQNRNNYISFMFDNDKQAHAFMMFVEIEKLNNLCDDRTNLISK